MSERPRSSENGPDRDAELPKGLSLGGLLSRFRNMFGGVVQHKEITEAPAAPEQPEPEFTPPNAEDGYRGRVLIQPNTAGEMRVIPVAPKKGPDEVLSPDQVIRQNLTERGRAILKQCNETLDKKPSSARLLELKGMLKAVIKELEESKGDAALIVELKTLLMAVRYCIREAQEKEAEPIRITLLDRAQLMFEQYTAMLKGQPDIGSLNLARSNLKSVIQQLESSGGNEALIADLKRLRTTVKFEIAQRNAEAGEDTTLLYDE